MTANKEICFTIIERKIVTTMEGDREESHGWEAGDELNVSATNFDDVVSTVRKWAAEDSVEVCRTRHGIGSMTRPVYEAYAWCEDESGEFVACDEYGDKSDDGLIYMLDVLDLHPEYREAWDKAKHDYYKFLDYEGETFGQVADYIEGE